MIEMAKPLTQRCDKIFVYCDLKHRGKLNHILVSSGCRLVKKANIERFAMYNILNSYPIITPSGKTSDSIVGEIWALGHPKILDSLDNIKSPMTRYVFEVGKDKTQCWVYYMPDSAFNDSASGVMKNKDGKWKV